MESSEHELPTRDPRSVLHELDYWRGVNEEVLHLCRVPPRIADRLIQVLVAMLELALGGDLKAAVERVGDHVEEALAAVSALDDQIGAITELVEGRLLSLRREAGLEK